MTISGYCPVAPDLVVEIKSPSDSEQAVDDKAAMWLSHGVRIALVINPETGTIRVRQPDLRAVILAMDDTLDLGDDIAGVHLRGAGDFGELGRLSVAVHDGQPPISCQTLGA